MSLVFIGSSNTINSDGLSAGLQLASDGTFRATNMPFCYVTKTNGAGWETYTSIVYFNDVRQNVGNCYNPSSGYFVCPAPGRYRVDVSYLAGQGTNGYVNAYIQKNGVAVTGNFHTNTNGVSYWANCSGCCTVYAQAGDTFSFYVSTGTGALYTQSSYMQMIVSMIL